MKLEDIASRFRKPCIMDIKVWSLTPHTLSRYTPHHTLHFQHHTYLTLLHLTPYGTLCTVYTLQWTVHVCLCKYTHPYRLYTHTLTLSHPFTPSQIGKRVWDDFAERDKIEREMKKFPAQEIIGFRIIGMRVGHTHQALGLVLDTDT